MKTKDTCAACFLISLFTFVSGACAIVVHENDTVQSHDATFNLVNPPIPGVASLDPGGVVWINNVSHPILPNTAGTGVLLKGSRYVLTAAHIFEDPIQDYHDNDVLQFRINFQKINGDTTVKFFLSFDDPPSPFDLSQPGQPFEGQNLYPHPLYIERGNYDRAIAENIHSQFGDLLTGQAAGYDIVLIDLGEDFAADLRASNYPTYELFVGSPVGQQFVNVGYGWRGTGDVGWTVGDDTQQHRYWGTNMFDAVDVPLFTGYSPTERGTAREETQLIYDFDDGTFTHDSLADYGFPDPLNLPGESYAAPGDSGAPLFVFSGGSWKVAAVESFGFGGPRDADQFDNGTYGEIESVVNLNAHSNEDNPSTPYDDTQLSIIDWIHNITGIATTFKNSGGTSDIEVASEWAFGQLPTPTMDAYVSFDTPNPTDVVPIFGPAFPFNVASFNMAAGQGHKVFYHQYGGSMSMTGDFTLDTNNSVGFFNGDISANRLIVQAYSSVPDPQRGLFFWQDNSNSTNLTVDRIIVANGGDFSYEVANPNQLDANHLELHEFGRAFLETDMTINQSVTNSGVLDLGDNTPDNTLFVGNDGYTQTDLGFLYIQAGDSGTNLISDSIITTGTANLAGLLQVFLDPGTQLFPHEFTPLITADEILGTFDDTSFPTSGFLTLRTLYLTDAVLLSTVSLQPGDADGDGDVDNADLLTVKSTFGNIYPQSILGDTDGDLDVDIHDFIAVKNNFGSTYPGLTPGLNNITLPGVHRPYDIPFLSPLATATLPGAGVPEPTSLSIFTLVACGLAFPRRRFTN